MDKTQTSDLEEECNNNIKECICYLKQEYKLKDSHINIINKNIELILDELIKFYHASNHDYKSVGTAWRCVASQYYKDVLTMYDKYEDYEIRGMYTNEIKKYVNKLVKMAKGEHK